MKLTVLGSGTLIPDPRRRSAGHLLEGDGFRLLLDCGSGTLHSLGGLNAWQGLTHVALTHFHTDHIGDLAPLLFAFKHGLAEERAEPLTVLGPRGLRALVGDLSRAFGDFVEDPGFPVVVEEMSEGQAREWRDGALTIRAHSTVHTDSSLGYRIQAGDGSVGYTGDTGFSEALGDFLRGVDVLVVECSHPDPPRVETHLTPGGVARLAGRVQPRLVVTVHHYPELDPARVPDLVAEKGYTGGVAGGQDGLGVHIGPDGVGLAAEEAD